MGITRFFLGPGLLAQRPHPESSGHQRGNDQYHGDQGHGRGQRLVSLGPLECLLVNGWLANGNGAMVQPGSKVVFQGLG